MTKTWHVYHCALELSWLINSHMSASQLKQVAMESKCDPLGVKKIPHGRFQGDQKNCPTLFMKVLDLFCHVALALSSRFVKFFKSFSIKHHQPFRALRHLPFFFRNSRYSREEKRMPLWVALQRTTTTRWYPRKVGITQFDVQSKSRFPGWSRRRSVTSKCSLHVYPYAEEAQDGFAEARRVFRSCRVAKVNTCFIWQPSYAYSHQPATRIKSEANRPNSGARKSRNWKESTCQISLQRSKREEDMMCTRTFGDA